MLEFLDYFFLLELLEELLQPYYQLTTLMGFNYLIIHNKKKKYW